MTPPTSNNTNPKQPQALSTAEYEVLEGAAHPPVHRTANSLKDELEASAILPALKVQPGSHDEIIDDDRRAVSQVASHSLAHVLEMRRSRTDSSRPLTRLQLLTILTRSFRVIDAGSSEDGTCWSLRPTPSGGAAHPFDLLVSVADVYDIEPGHYVFGPNAISLRRLSIQQSDYADTLSTAIMDASRRQKPAPATICLVANVERTAQRYVATLTILLRDAGALLATMHLVATDLGLHSSIIGSAGHFEVATSRQTTGDSLQNTPTVVDCGGLVLSGS